MNEKTLPVLVWFRPFISNRREDFSIHFVAGWPNEKLLVALWKMEGLVGVHSGFFLQAPQVAITLIVLVSLLFHAIKQ